MSFSSDIDNFAIDFIEGSEESIRATAISVFGDIIKSTPVDEGRLRANWFASGLSPSERITTSRDQSGSVALSNVTRVIMQLQNWSEFNLTNNLPYAPIAEYGGYGDGPNTIGGYSKQAPGGMVRTNIARASAILEREARRRLPR